MSRYKILPLLLVVGLLSILIPLTIALAQGGGGTVRITDSDENDFSGTLSDKAWIELTGLPPLGSDQAYEGWFVSDDGSRKESTGILTPGGNGNVSTTFWFTKAEDRTVVTGQDATGDDITGVVSVKVPTGENLFANFDKFLLTIEPVPDTDPGPSGVVPLIHAIPEGGIAHIRHLIYSWQGNPEYKSGVHQGTPKGILVGLREQTWTALVHARLGLSSTDVAAVQQHAEHVVNIIEGSGGANFGDLDGDGTEQNPGDGFGVLGYAPDAKHATFAASAAPDDAVIVANGRNVVASADEVAAWAGLARDQAMLAASNNDIEVAKLFLSNAEARLVSSLNSAKGAYMSAQAMGMYTLAAEPEVVAPPDTGDPAVPNVALAVLIAGAVLLLGAAYIYRRSRSSARQTS